MGHYEINAGIGTLHLPGEPRALREAAKQFDEATGDIRDARRLLAKIELGPGGRLHNSVGALVGLFEAATRAFDKDATTLEHVGDGARRLAQVLDDLGNNELPHITHRWVRAREEAVEGGPQADQKASNVEATLVGQYHDVITKLGGRQLLSAVEGAHFVEAGGPAAQPIRREEWAPAQGGHEAAGGAQFQPHQDQAAMLDHRITTYRHTLQGILEDLDHVVRRWRTADAEMADRLGQATPEAMQPAHEKRAARLVEEEHDYLRDAIHSIDEAAAPLQKAQNVIKTAVGTLIDARGPEAGDGDWHAPKFRDEWSHHYQQVESRLRRAAQKTGELREQVQALDEKFASAFFD